MTSRKQYLPKSGLLQVDELKILQYLLNDKHPEGKSKAKFFKGRGFRNGEWLILQSALVQHGKARPIVSTETTSFGIKYVVECALETPDGIDSCVRTVWVAERDNTFRLVTAYPITG